MTFYIPLITGNRAGLSYGRSRLGLSNLYVIGFVLVVGCRFVDKERVLGMQLVPDIFFYKGVRVVLAFLTFFHM